MTYAPITSMCLILLAVTTCATQKLTKCEPKRCVSTNFSYVQCKAPQYIINIRLLQQNSISRCIYGKSFGSYGSNVWVDKGCRGTFEICFGTHRHRHVLYNY